MSVRFHSNRREVVGRFRGALDRNLRAATDHYLSELRKNLLRGQRSGRRYRVPGGKTRKYTASAPGEYPANRTGTLAQSYQEVPVGKYRVIVGTPLEYGRYLELGTRNMQPRPHFKRTFRDNRNELERLLGERM